MTEGGGFGGWFKAVDAPLIGAIVIALTLSAAFLVFQAKSAEYECQQQTGANQAQAAQTSSSSNVAESGQAQQEGGQQPQQPQACQTQHGLPYVALALLRRLGRLLRRYSELVTAMSTVVLTVFTGLLWVSTKRLWEASNAQASDVKAQIKATESLAGAAQKTADVAERGMLKVERPYVYISPVGNIMYIKEKNIKFECTNYGRTPALIREVWSKMLIAGVSPRPPFDFTGSTLWRCHTPLGPSSKPVEYPYSVPDDVPVAKSTFHGGSTWEMITEIPDGMKIFFMAEVVYSDAEGATHSTSDCWEYIPAKTIFFRVDNPDCHSMT